MSVGVCGGAAGEVFGWLEVLGSVLGEARAEAGVEAVGGVDDLVTVAPAVTPASVGVLTTLSVAKLILSYWVTIKLW